VEFFTCGTWIRSRTISQEFPSQEEAEKAIKRWSPSTALLRAVRLFPPLKPKKEMWVIDYRMSGTKNSKENHEEKGEGITDQDSVV
jgi:hypothetical protein